MTVVVSDNILPAFTQLGPYCLGATPDIAYDFIQRHYWYLEQCNNHRCYRFDGVYIHAYYWPLCYSGYYDRGGVR